MFVPNFISSKTMQLTPEIAQWNSEQLKKLYQGKNPVHYQHNDLASNLEQSLEQMQSLLTFVIEHTKGKYPIFKVYKERQIDSLKDTNSVTANVAGLHRAKKDLEGQLWFICNNAIRPELVQDYEVSRCAVGASSQFNMALRHFSTTAVESTLHMAKENLLRGIVQAFIAEWDLSPGVENEIHYVNAYFNFIASEYGCNEQEDNYAPLGANLNALDKLPAFIEERFTLDLFLAEMHRLLPSLPHEAFDAGNTNTYSCIEDYAKFFGITESTALKRRLQKLYVYTEEEKLVDGKEVWQVSMVPKTEFQTVLDALLVEQLYKLKVLAEVTLKYQGIAYLFNGTGFLKILANDEYVIPAAEEQNALQKQIMSRALGRENDLSSFPIKTEAVLPAFDKEHLIDFYKMLFSNDNQFTLRQKCYLQIIRQTSCHDLFFQEIFKNENYCDKKHVIKFARTVLRHPTDLSDQALIDLAEYIKKEEPHKVSKFVRCAYKNRAYASLKAMITCCFTLFNVNEAMDDYGNTLALILIAVKQNEAVKLLLERGIAVNHKNARHNTVLHHAALNGDWDLAQLILSKGAEISQVNLAGGTALMFAAEKGHLKTLEVLLANGADVNQITKENQTALLYAVYNNHPEAAEYLLEKGAINVPHASGISPFLLAAQRGHLNVVKHLIKTGVDINQQNAQLMTALYLAVNAGMYEVVQALIEAGADVNQANDKGTTPLFIAAEKGYTDLVNLLILKGANVNQCNLKAAIPLHIASENGHLSIVAALLEGGADVNQATDLGLTPLFLAVREGFEPVVDKLLEKGADVNRPNQSLETPLMAAVKGNFVTIVSKLLENKADPNQKGKRGVSAFLTACYRGPIESVRNLIKHGADVNQENNDGDRPLLAAAQAGHAAVIDVLLENGAEIDKGRGLVTPLLMAVQSGHFEAVKTLVDHGADLTLTDQPNKTLLALAAYKGHLDVVSFLLEKGERIEDKNKIHPLGAAASRGHFKVVQLLLEKGAAVDVVDDGQTPLLIAVQNGHIEVVELLLSKGADVNCSYQTATALFYAAQYGNGPMVKVLLKAGANMSPLNKSAEELLTFAKSESMEIQMRMMDWILTQMLLKKFSVDQEERRLLILKPDEIAAIMGHEEVATLIRQAALKPIPIPALSVSTFFTETDSSKDHEASDLNNTQASLFTGSN